MQRIFNICKKIHLNDDLDARTEKCNFQIQLFALMKCIISLFLLTLEIWIWQSEVYYLKKEIDIHSLSANKNPSIQFPIGAKGLYFTAVSFRFSL